MYFCKVVFRLLLILSFLGAPFFAVVGYMVLCSRSMSLTFRLHSSTGLSPVSIDICSFMLSMFLALLIIFSSFAFVGILICFASALYFGISHSIL